MIPRGINNWSAALTQGLLSDGEEIHVPEEAGARVFSPTYLTIDDEIILVSGFRRASAQHGEAGVNLIQWRSTGILTPMNGITITILEAVASTEFGISESGFGLEIQLETDENAAVLTTCREVVEAVMGLPGISSAISGYTEHPDATAPDDDVATFSGEDTSVLVVRKRGAQGTGSDEHLEGATAECRMSSGYLDVANTVSGHMGFAAADLAACDGEPVLSDVEIGGIKAKAWGFLQGEESSVSGVLPMPPSWAGVPSAMAIVVFFSGGDGDAVLAIELGNIMKDMMPHSVAWSGSGQPVPMQAGLNPMILPVTIDASLLNSLRLSATKVTRYGGHEDDTLDAPIALVSLNFLEATDALQEILT